MAEDALTALEGVKDRTVLTTLERIARNDVDDECRIVALEMLDTMGPEGVAAAESVREAWRTAPKETVQGVELSMLNPESE